MGYRAQNARDEDERKAWRGLPPRERYNWRAVAVVSTLCALMAIAAATRLIASVDMLRFHR